MLKLKAFVFISFVTFINSAPLNDPGTQSDFELELFGDKKPVTLLKFVNEPFTPESRQYRFEYETSDGQGREEIGKLLKNKEGVDYMFVRGSYTYTGPDGIRYTVFYAANEDGFQATGDHIPGKENELPVDQISQNAVISLIG